MKLFFIACLFFSLGCCDVSAMSREEDIESLKKIIEENKIDVNRYLPFLGCPDNLLLNEVIEYHRKHSTSANSENIFIDLVIAKRNILAKLARAQEFRNHIHLVLSDLLANAEYDLKAKSPGDSDGISLDELRAIQEQIRKISVLSANNADLLQFMEEGGLDKLESSLKEDLQIIPQASKSLIIEIINAYKSKTERYPLDLLKNGKLKVYLGVATSVSADAPAKPTLVSAEVQADAPAKPTLEVSSPVELVSVDAPAKPTLEVSSPVELVSVDAPAKPHLEVSSPAIVDEFDKPQETKLSFSDAVGVDKQLGNSKAKTPPASPVRRSSPFLSQFKKHIQQTPSPRKKRRGSRFSLGGKVSYNEQAWHTGRVPTGDASKPRQKDFYRPRSPHDKDGASYPDSAEQRTQEAQAFRNAQKPKLDHVNQEARDAARRSQIPIPRAH